ncbi:hypothetical protein B566_EDAN004449 [Ephemera danica]|nr:hypothetical protein B566_EDAN004449 [Ephemera danica]
MRSKLRHGGGIGNDLDIQHFRFSEHSTRNKVSDASMFIWVPEMSRPVRVRVYQVMGNATEHQSMMVLLIASSKLSEQRKPGWVEVDTRKLLIDWFKSPHDNLGVVFKLEDSTGHSIPYSTDTHDHGEETKQPFVRVLTTDGRKHRSKRTIGLNCHENSQETRCCRYPLTVDFEEFGWDWIIAPKKYDANYCSGECPYVFLQKYPHTHIVQQANPQGTAGPCCAPRKMSSISMLYFDNEFNIIYGLLPGMVVDRCGCQ